ncbi:MAG: Radical SAM superfamily protein [bacterium ADurb.Bin157]|nr:MAG: Radical SAM superfamily protein [bacterium ADurb.Bin157]
MTNIIDHLSHWELLNIEKPARYLGGEANQAQSKTDPALKVALVFPDLYELGMSNLAIKIFYESLNNTENIMAERVFSPWIDFEALLRKKDLPIYSLETGRPLYEFDVIFISFPYEMTFTNVLNILDLGKVELCTKNRTNWPIVIGGGPSASNPLPMAKFMDGIFIGDGEESILEICNKLIEFKKQNLSLKEVRMALAEIEGLWVPEFPRNVRRRIFKGFANSAPPLKPVIPNVQAIHNRAPIEIFRGCINGCRFCNAGYYYRPKRERSSESLIKYAHQLLENTGEESLGLLSLSTSDYSELSCLIEGLDRDKLYPEQTVSIPSMRMTDNTIKLLNSSSRIRKGGLTFAPEAGTQKLRNIINKNITEEDIIHVMKTTGGSEYRTVKLYLMMGLPFETDEDISGIVNLVEKLDNIGRTCSPKKQITVSLSGFVPKAFTPFQWSRQNTIEELKNKRFAVCKGLERRRVQISWRDEYLCLLEAVLSRGDEQVGDLVLAAFRNGCKFDGWHECFSKSGWEKAFEDTQIQTSKYTSELSINSPLPWDFIDFRTPKAFYREEYLKAAQIAGVTPE